jgi:hypothetical protein
MALRRVAISSTDERNRLSGKPSIESWAVKSHDFRSGFNIALQILGEFLIEKHRL